jgi:hypothetical protein
VVRVDIEDNAPVFTYAAAEGSGKGGSKSRKGGPKASGGKAGGKAGGKGGKSPEDKAELVE